MAYTRIYKIWEGIKTRCCNPNYHYSKDYSERGITICEDWMDFNVFQAWAFSNGYGDNLTIERIENNKGYSPDNCCWITKGKQARNRRNNRVIKYKNKLLCLAEVAEEIKINPKTLEWRLNAGWGIKRATTTPARRKSI